MFNQNGTIRILPILLIIVAVGIISFLLVSSIVPFRSGFWSKLFPKPPSHAAVSTDWNQVGKDPQHTSFSSETLGSNIKVAWTHPFQPDRVFPSVQAIVYDDGGGSKVFVGTEGANGQQPTLYAIWAGTTTQNPNAGKVAWKFPLPASVLNSVAADNGKVYVADMDGALYALNSSNGTQVWKVQLSHKGFTGSPVFSSKANIS